MGKVAGHCLAAVCPQWQHVALAQGVQKPQHGRGHAQFARNGQADDAVGMEGGGKGNAIFSVLGYGPVDQVQELVIPPVEVP